MLFPIVKVQPTFEPVTVDEVCDALIIDRMDDKLLIEQSISSAREYCEADLNYKIVQQTLSVVLDDFADCEYLLPYSKEIQSVEISYMNSSGFIEEVDSSTYSISRHSLPTKIFLKHNESWPDVYPGRENVTINYVTGFSSAELIPARLKTAIIALTGSYLENRESQQARQIYENPTTQSILDQFRIHPV